ncbi:hypothetical protein LOAG_13858, partial [Loa loa]
MNAYQLIIENLAKILKTTVNDEVSLKNDNFVPTMIIMLADYCDNSNCSYDNCIK